jgi:hypothetical protein
LAKGGTEQDIVIGHQPSFRRSSPDTPLHRTSCRSPVSTGRPHRTADDTLVVAAAFPVTKGWRGATIHANVRMSLFLTVCVEV